MIAQLRSGGWRLRLLLVNEWDSKASARSLARQLEGRSWTLNVVFSGFCWRARETDWRWQPTAHSVTSCNDPVDILRASCA